MQKDSMHILGNPEDRLIFSENNLIELGFLFL